jgi:hypothetical protein
VVGQDVVDVVGLATSTTIAARVNPVELDWVTITHLTYILLTSKDYIMILNLTQHAATPEQIAQGVIDLPTPEREVLIEGLTVNILPTRDDITRRCARIATLAVCNGLGGDLGDDPAPSHAMIGGAPWMMAELERALQDVNIQPLYAFSVRESVDQHQPDGSVRKVNVFRHAGFVRS